MAVSCVASCATVHTVQFNEVNTMLKLRFWNSNSMSIFNIKKTHFQYFGEYFKLFRNIFLIRLKLGDYISNVTRFSRHSTLIRSCRLLTLWSSDKWQRQKADLWLWMSRDLPDLIEMQPWSVCSSETPVIRPTGNRCPSANLLVNYTHSLLPKLKLRHQMYELFFFIYCQFM